MQYAFIDLDKNKILSTLELDLTATQAKEMSRRMTQAMRLVFGLEEATRLDFVEVTDWLFAPVKIHNESDLVNHNKEGIVVGKPDQLFYNVEFPNEENEDDRGPYSFIISEVVFLDKE